MNGEQAPAAYSAAGAAASRLRRVVRAALRAARTGRAVLNPAC